MSANQDIIEYRLSGGRTNTTKSNSLGGDMSEDAAAVIQSSAPLNLFDHVTLDRMVTGEFHYMTLYINCKNATEGLPSAKWWLDLDTLSDENEFAWALEYDPNSVYHYYPHKQFNGTTDFISVDSTASLQLLQFSVSCWFCTSKDYSTAGHIVNKGGVGSDSAGQNDNYSIVMTSSGKIKGGFEEGNGTDHYATSPLDYNDGKWHHAVVTYDQITVRLYIDGVEVATHTTTTTPETNTQPLVIGRNSRTSAQFFEGLIDEVYVWNNDLTASEVLALCNSGTIPQTGNIVHKNTMKIYNYHPFRRFNGTSDNHQIPHTSSLSVTQFTVQAWFRTTKNYSAAFGYILNKGQFTTETAGQNINYSIGINQTTNTMFVLFETSAGVNVSVNSISTYNDGKWHLITGTYDQVNLKMYIDGQFIAQTANTNAPDNNTLDLFIGSDNGGTSLFEGDIDEVGIWNNDLTADEILDYFNNGTIPQTGALVFTEKYGDDNGSVVAQSLSSVTQEPLGVDWKTVASEPSNTNLYVRDIQKCHTSNIFSSFLPIQIRRRILPNSITDQENAKGNFILKGLLRRSNTDQGSGEGGSQTPNPVTNFKIGSVGDSDCTSMFNNVLGEMRTRAVDYFLFLGDQTYNGTSCWFDRFTSAELGKTYITIGNHDEDGGKRSTWEGQFSMPDGYKRVDIENVAIIIMDSESSFSIGSAQYNKIQEELQKASQDNNIDWIIVTIHRPFVSTDSDHPPNEGGKADIYLPLFTQYKVDLVLQGHNHNYQRSKLLKDNTSDHENPTVVTSGSTFTKGQGFVVVTCGLGGHDSGSSLYSLDNTPSWQQYQQRTDNGFLEIEFSGTNNTILTGRLVNIDGEVMDTFTIS